MAHSPASGQKLAHLAKESPRFGDSANTTKLRLHSLRDMDDASDQAAMPHNENGDKAFGTPHSVARALISVRHPLGSPPSTTRAVPGNDLSVVAAQLIEAACKARDGDLDATKVHIEYALSLLRGQAIRGPKGVTASSTEIQIARGGLPAWQVRKVRAYVETNLSRKVPIRDVANFLGLSASHFCRAFKCTLGISPRQYVLRCRIELAQGLMLTTSDPLSDIAVRCGMCDQQHFARSFRRLVGETPSNWRRARRGSLSAREEQKLTHTSAIQGFSPG
jgi:AraC family transcriptional regulator